MKLGRHSDKKKAFLLLLGLTTYCFFMILVFNFGDVFQNSRKNEVFFEGSLSEIEYRRVEEVEKVEAKVIGAETVNEAKVVGSCDAFLGGSISAPQFFCPGENMSPDVEFRDENLTSDQKTALNQQDDDDETTIKVSKNAEIVLVEIYAPSSLFAGSLAPFDNVVRINNPEGRVAFRNAAEMVNPEFDYLANMPPGFGDERFEEFGEGVDMEPFKMHYKASEDVEGVEQFVFDSNEESLCPDVVNKGSFNARQSNALSQDLTRSISPPDLVNFDDRQETGFCKDFNSVYTIDLEEEHSFLLCQETEGQQFFRDLVGSFKIIGNLFGSPSQTFDFGGVVIDAAFGSAENCNEEDCSIRYFEAGRLMLSPPTMSEDLYPASVLETAEEEDINDYLVSDPIILTTPCKVRIDSREVSTRCIWDLSAWSHLFHLDEIFTYPGFENKYSKMEYFEAMKRELKGEFMTYGGLKDQEFLNGDRSSSEVPSILDFCSDEVNEHIRKLAEDRGYKPQEDNKGVNTNALEQWKAMQIAFSKAYPLEKMEILGEGGIYGNRVYRTHDASRAFFQNKLQELRKQSHGNDEDFCNAILNKEYDDDINEVLKTNAPPGYSEHHTGRAFDISCNGNSILNNAFAQTNCYTWLNKNAGEYGFSESYPENGKNVGADWEPWHWYYSNN
jgi:hypothetical protein